MSMKLSEKQHDAICNIFNGFRKLNVDPQDFIFTDTFDETSYENTSTTSQETDHLIKDLSQALDKVYKSRC